MRAKEFLLEYNASVTMKQFGPALSRVFDEQGNVFDWLAAQYNYLYTQWEENNDAHGRPERDDERIVHRFQAQAMLEFLEGCDPTENEGAFYTPWIVSRITSGKVKLEDCGKVKDALIKFHRLKQSGWFKRNPEQRHLSDIGRFRDNRVLTDFLDGLGEKDYMSNTAKDKAREEEMIANGEAVVLADKPTFKIIIPKTMEAAQHFGRNTRWCTSAKERNAFSSYTADGDDLYIILDKRNNRRWQFYFGREPQFMNEEDKDISGYYSDEDWGSLGDWHELPGDALDIGYWKDALAAMKYPADIRMLNEYGPEEWKEFIEYLMETHGIEDSY